MDLFRSGLQIFVARLCKSAISFLAVVVFSRELGANSMGVYYPFIALLTLLAIPSDFDISGATEKRISEDNEKSSYLGTALVLKASLLAITSLFLFSGREYINQYLGINLAIALILTLYASQAATFSLHILRGELRVGETAVIEVLRPLSWLTMGYIFYTQGYGVKSLVYGYLIGSIIMSIIGWWKVSVPIGRPTITHARSIFDYGRYSVISSVGSRFYSSMDVAILSVFVAVDIAVTRGEIGAYENAWRLSLIVVLFSQSIATTLFPQFSRWNAENATNRIEALIPKALLPSLLIVIPAFVGTVILAKDLLSILFGPEFTVAWIALIILTGEKIFQSIHAILGQALQAVNRPDLSAYATIVAILINFILNIVLIWEFGIVGAALATSISFAVNTGIQAYYLSTIIDIGFPVSATAWSLISSSLMGLTIYVFKNNREISSIFELVMVIVVGIITYSIFVLLYQPIRSEVRNILHSNIL
ncbi:oligosaccharide flippase family protein [Haloarcula brevis]|uniref:oligosaccharide flippase family protein n=1 Tax=Haloarcula brevis TaxID=3111453 RepID=UPI00300F7973